MLFLARSIFLLRIIRIVEGFQTLPLLGLIETKIEFLQGNRNFMLRLNLHQKLNFPLLYCMIRLMGKKFVHKFSKVKKFQNR